MNTIRSRLTNRLTLHALAATLLAVACIAEAAETSPAARTLHFPPDRSLGMLHMEDASIPRKIEDFYHWIDGTGWHWEYLGEAMGDVTVPAGKRLRLILNKSSSSNLSGLTQLAADDLYELVLSETVDEQCLSNLTSLTGLKVLGFPHAWGMEKKLHLFTPDGLKQLQALKSLERLHAPDQLTAAGLAALAEALPQLRAFYSKSPLTDEALAVLPRFKSLEELELGGPKMSNRGLAHLARISTLRYLLIWGVNDQAMLPVRQISSLQILHVPESITDAGVAYLVSHPNLEVLDLYNSKVTDRGVAHLKSLPALKKVNLGKKDYDHKHPPFTDAATVHLKAIKTLEHLVLLANGLTDTGVSNLAELSNLKQLELPMGGPYCHPYTEKSLQALARLRSLQALYLAGPGVTDTVLSHIAQLTNLHSLTLFACPISNEGLARLSTLKDLETLNLIVPAQVTISGLNYLRGLSRLTHLRADSLHQDGVALDLSPLARLEDIMLTPAKGSTFRDEDLICLAELKRLKWLQLGSLDLAITDAGMTHLAGLTALNRFALGGPGVTDRGLAVLAKLPQLNLVRTAGNFTDAGLQQLEGLTGLTSLTIHTAKNFSPAAKQRLRQHLPNLYQLTVDGDSTTGNFKKASTHPKPGTPAPDFTVTTLDGAKFTLFEQRGKVVMLHFWGTWCTPCVKGLPAMKTFHERLKQKYGDRIVFIDLVMDDSEDKLRSLVAAHSLTTPQARIGMHSKLAASYGVASAPDDFMIGPDGRILLNRESPEGSGDTERVIDKALGLPAAKSTSLPVRSAGQSES